MNELFSRFELVRQELARIAGEINKATPNNTSAKACVRYLQDDIHSVRGRLMQVEGEVWPKGEKCNWQIVDGTVEVNIRKDRPI